MEGVLDEGERRLGAVGLGHLPQAIPIPTAEPERGPSAFRVELGLAPEG